VDAVILCALAVLVVADKQRRERAPDKHWREVVNDVPNCLQPEKVVVKN